MRGRGRVAVRPSPDPAPGTPPQWAARPPTRREPALNSSSTHRSTQPSASYRARHSAVDSVLRMGMVDGEGVGVGVGVVGLAASVAAAAAAWATAGPSEEVPTVRPMGPSMLSRVPKPRPAGFCW